jgi:hypothetical protein
MVCRIALVIVAESSRPSSCTARIYTEQMYLLCLPNMRYHSPLPNAKICGKGKQMDHLECPSPDAWNERRDWFEAVDERCRGEASYFVSEQACALTADVQCAFCAGAWGAVVILAMCVVDGALRETELPGFRGNTKELLDAADANPQLQDLRRRRNALVHVDADQPALTVDQQWCNRAELEQEARRAVELMFEAFYIGPWV